MTIPTKNVELKVTRGNGLTTRSAKTRNVLNPRGVNAAGKPGQLATNKTTGTILSPRCSDRKYMSNQPANTLQSIGNLKPQTFEYQSVVGKGTQHYSATVVIPDNTSSSTTSIKV